MYKLAKKREMKLRIARQKQKQSREAEEEKICTFTPSVGKFNGELDRNKLARRRMGTSALLYENAFERMNLRRFLKKKKEAEVGLKLRSKPSINN